MEKLNEISGKILDSAIEVHRHTGPGLLESIYEKCLCKEFDLRKINYKRQVTIPIHYKDMLIGENLRLDILVEDDVLLELKAIEILDKIHTAQVVTYLKLTK